MEVGDKKSHNIINVAQKPAKSWTLVFESTSTCQKHFFTSWRRTVQSVQHSVVYSTLFSAVHCTYNAVQSAVQRAVQYNVSHNAIRHSVQCTSQYPLLEQVHCNLLYHIGKLQVVIEINQINVLCIRYDSKVLCHSNQRRWYQQFMWSLSDAHLKKRYESILWVTQTRECSTLDTPSQTI